MPCCAAFNCSNRHETGFRLFRFPSNKTRSALWIAKVKRDNCKPTSCSALCEAHFEDNQFERNRKDGWRKLRPNAVPTLFTHSVPVRVRKPPLKRSLEENPRKTAADKRLRVEHSYSSKSSPNFSTTTAMAEVQLYDASKNSDTVFRREDLATSESLSNSTAHATSHSVTSSTTSAADTTPSCASCCTLNDRINKLQKQLATKARLFAALRDRHKAALRKLHFDASQFELKRQDGWRKLKWTAVPTLRPPPSSDHQPSKKHKRESFTERQIDSSLKLADGEEFHNDASVTSAETVAGNLLDDQQESDVKASSKKLCSFGVNRDTGTRVVRDKRVLRNLLGTIAENIRNFSFHLQETTNRKSQLMQAVNSLTQEEIMLQRRLKKESDKENVVKQQLQEIEDEEKDLLKVEEPCSEELDILMQQNHHEDMRTEDWKVEQQCCKELSAFIEKDSHNGLQIAAQKENDLIANNILRETSAAKQMELKLFDGLVAFSIVDSVQFVTLKLVTDENTSKSSDSNPGLLKDSTTLTDSSDTAQADDLTMFAESLAEKTDRVECDSFDQSTQTVCGVETSAPPMLLKRNHVCSFCGKRFWNAGARQSHELSHGTEFRCDICDKVFSYRTGLINHKKIHSDEKPFECTLCDRHFKTNGTLNRHFRSHTREKHYACSVCSETFFYDHQRQVHMSVHTGKQPFVCQDCGRGFSSNGCLTRHVRIHRGEKPYECDVCGKRFRQGNQVKAHKEMHGEKPYVCSRCGKRLGLGSFWTHMKQHSADIGVKIYYQCAVCDKKLSTKKTLEMHTRMVHMGEAPYVCDICYKEFGKHKDFQLHKKEHDHCSS